MPTLLILAAGVGSRYGGLKQIDAVGPHGESIIDYSMYDAVRAGFDRLVFIIRPEFEAPFREKAGNNFERAVECRYAFQTLTEGLGEFPLPEARKKPWGTGHAVLSAKAHVDGPFAVINGDDYYGPGGFRAMAGFLNDAASPAGDAPAEYAMVGYRLRNTLSEHGYVSRGVCAHDASMHLETVVERTHIVKEGISAYFLEDDVRHDLTGDEIVSMNLWGFTPDLYPHLEAQFAEFLAERGGDPKAEFYIPAVVDRLVKEGRARAKVVPTDETWFGITYPEDKAVVQGKIRERIAEGVYPERLWEPA